MFGAVNSIISDSIDKLILMKREQYTAQGRGAHRGAGEERRERTILELERYWAEQSICHS